MKRSAENGFTGLRRSAENGFTGLRRSAENGFTLVELMVALLIFAMLAITGAVLLNMSVKAQAIAQTKLDDISDIRRMNSLFAADLAQAVPRTSRDQNGKRIPAFYETKLDGRISIDFIRSGGGDTEETARPNMQKIRYIFGNGRVERASTDRLDGVDPQNPVVLLSNVNDVKLRYRNRGEWRDAWNPTRDDAMPDAVELVIARPDKGGLLQLFQVGVRYP